jgi:hypothetical protein
VAISQASLEPTSDTASMPGVDAAALRRVSIRKSLWSTPGGQTDDYFNKEVYGAAAFHLSPMPRAHRRTCSGSLLHGPID